MLIFPSFFNAGKPTYEIEQSLRFDGSSALEWIPSSLSYNTSTWTWSVWIKRGVLGAPGTGGRTILSVLQNATQYHKAYFYGNDGTDNDYLKTAPGNQLSDGVYRDPSAWYHLVVRKTGSSASDVVKWYINGVEVKSGAESYTGNPARFLIGASRNDSSNTRFFDGYLAEFNFVDGSSLAPTDFGKENSDGVWIPKKYGGSYGTNGFYLKFDPDATNGVGHDHSGNGNHFTPTGFVTSGTGTDVMSDTPTTNWATLSPLGGSFQTRHTLSEGNLKYTQSASTGNAATMNSQGTIGVSSGKWYWEISDSENSVYGFMQSQQEAGNYQTTGGWVYYMGSDGYGGVTNFSHSNGISTTDVIGMALDMDNNTCACYKNNTLMGTFTTIPDGTYFPTASVNSSSTSGRGTYNFGQRAFTYTPPSGFKPLNTANLPAPTVKDGSKNFDTKLFTAGTTTVTGLSFQPDLVWAKNRDQAYNHRLIDAVRGVKNDLYSNTTAAEQTNQSDSLLTFTTDGFTHGKFGSADADDFAAWNWKANGSGSSNTDGNVTSTVSANPTAGFSIVAYQSSTTTKPLNVGHGLGVKPSFILTKNRDATASWGGYHSALGATKGIFINSTSAAITSTDYWNNTEPTSTVFTVFDSNNTHSYGTTNDFIAYCFAEVEGYSKFGKYVSNNSADGPFVFCGFKPELVWLKKTSGASNWFMYDATRNEYNVVGNKLYADSAAAENGEDGGSTTSNTIDILSNGFKLRTNNGTNNGGDYIFCAWAQHPFGGDGVSPATAR